jgi:UDP-3-O-[3-hydroxymyristoyl] glucosamine N-acyltransferase
MTFSDGKTGVVGSYRYVNPDGTMGGVVAETAEVEPGAYIHVDAIVGPGGKVSAGEVVPKGAYIDEDTKSF